MFSITTALFMMGLFFMMVLITNKLTEKLKKDIEVQVFLKRGIGETEEYFVKVALSEKEYIDRKDNEPRIRYVSKEDAAAEMMVAMGEDFISFLGENPLRNAFIIHIREDFHTDEKMEGIKKDIESIQHVYEVAYTKNYVEEINQNTGRIGLVIGAFVSILLATVVILINNAIKLALFSQRFLIRSMQLVGATPFFIKKPFLVRSVLMGGSSGVIASVFVVALLFLSFTQLPEVSLVVPAMGVMLICLALVVLGALIGYLSTYLAVSRYLKMKLEDLY
jgi:cell division transport system permease protein